MQLEKRGRVFESLKSATAKTRFTISGEALEWRELRLFELHTNWTDERRNHF